ncbi:MAG: threonylcarbamoyl-AMP synthase [Halobacteriovoraceae bacterium]|nr:threonylcarbamoyl-AMP synthase [Halobacteriovoraceae bacterium]MCB9095669.1 threonylcarbamoyl-AMP synthase [Halobacteriovoraceae bacterium]
MKVNFNQALSLLQKNEVVAIPTETVYGLAGSITSEDALRKIFETKKRPFFDPLIVHISTLDDIDKIFDNPPSVIKKLADTFWPGPLTIVFKKQKHISNLITAGLPTVAVRMPNHKDALRLISKLRKPIAAPSANIFMRTSPTSAFHVEEEFGEKIPVFDGGDCQIGIESTVIGIDSHNNKLEIYRPGAILKSDLEKVVSPEFQVVYKNSESSPGQLKNHYQPAKPLFVVSHPDEIFTPFFDKFSKKMELVLPLDPLLAARQLYAVMRSLSKENIDLIYLVEDKYPKDGLWESLWERIQKASTPLPS